MSEYVLADTIQKHINQYIGRIEAIRDKYTSMTDEDFSEVDRAGIRSLQSAGMALVDLARDVLSDDVYKHNIAYPVDWSWYA